LYLGSLSLGSLSFGSLFVAGAGSLFAVGVDGVVGV
jgi:hypothetical protein